MLGLVEGMNFTPATPTFEKMRDGILQAVALTTPGDECLVWDAFADFGVGNGAKATLSRRGTWTITESTDRQRLPAISNLRQPVVRLQPELEPDRA